MFGILALKGRYETVSSCFPQKVLLGVLCEIILGLSCFAISPIPGGWRGKFHSILIALHKGQIKGPAWLGSIVVLLEKQQVPGGSDN